MTHSFGLARKQIEMRTTGSKMSESESRAEDASKVQKET
jgi:hypothetical protein